MDFDLRAKKLQQQADARIQTAKKKLEREQQLLRDQKLREEKLAELAILQKEKEEAEKLRLYEEEQLLLQKSGGILFSLKNLIPYQIDGEDDKIILPETSLLSLDQKNAFSHGHLCFELSSSMKPDIITHCGVREFSAENGTIGIPIKVIHSLFGNHLATINDIGSIDLHYRKLNKIKSAKFAPHSDEFFSLYKHNLKNVLEQNLKLHTCLSLGDILSVWYRGKSFFVTVAEMSPEKYGTLIDTDVEIDFIDYETHTSNMMVSSSDDNNDNVNINNKSSSSSSSSSSFGYSASLSSTTSTNLKNDNKVTPSSSSSSIASSSSFKVIKTASSSSPHSHSSNNTNTILPPPPTPTNNNDINILYVLEPEPEQVVSGIDDSHLIYLRIRLMNGATISRRFVKFQCLKQLFYYIAQETNMNMNVLKLTLPSLNKVFTMQTTILSQTESSTESQSAIECEKTFEELKFAKREMIMVSLIT
jgi:hypothetical protein